MLGAFVVLMVLVPIYTYEHHLVFLLLPAAILLKIQREHNRIFTALSYGVLFFLFWPLSWWREAQSMFPYGKWLIQESKMFSALLLMGLLCYSTLYSKESTD